MVKPPAASATPQSMSNPIHRPQGMSSLKLEMAPRPRVNLRTTITPRRMHSTPKTPGQNPISFQLILGMAVPLPVSVAPVLGELVLSFGEPVHAAQEDGPDRDDPRQLLEDLPRELREVVLRHVGRQAVLRRALRQQHEDPGAARLVLPKQDARVGFGIGLDPALG